MASDRDWGLAGSAGLLAGGLGGRGGLAAAAVEAAEAVPGARNPAATVPRAGQTGTGKTHTMTGDIAEELTAGAGVIPRAINQASARWWWWW